MMAANFRVEPPETMQALIETFWSILRLRAGPQILPASNVLLALILLLHWGIGVGLGTFSLTPEVALASALAGTVMVVAFVQGLLGLYGLRARAVQTLTALAGCEVLLGALAILLTAWFFAVPEAQRALPGLLSLLVLGWNIALAGHIFRHALGISSGMGLLAALGYILVSFALADFITPAPPG
ncbi:hypothetical protein [Thiohalomonas denitrificans]|uniref:hypothetical protein n=1 Tax=Thiohalomonas denitrificans TaxID=415747 RepID=UPI0026ECEC03|nr:hypothetical protein [Thiohalomonas denitrificans]